MLIFFILLILIAAFPLILIAWRMRWAGHIKKNGTHTNGIITDIRTVRGKAGYIDFLRFEYKDRATGRSYYGKATVQSHKYKIGDTMPVTYLPDRPAKYAIDTKGGYTFMLVFCILLFLFVLFAVYKLNEMVSSGQL